MTVEALVGKVLQEVKQLEDEIIFVCTDGTMYKMYHCQDCCESVSIEDVNGNWADLIGSPILKAEERTNQENPKEGYTPDSFTWTFYQFATIKGTVDVRWYGESNGYYSESVDFAKLSKDGQTPDRWDTDDE